MDEKGDYGTPLGDERGSLSESVRAVSRTHLNVFHRTMVQQTLPVPETSMWNQGEGEEEAQVQSGGEKASRFVFSTFKVFARPKGFPLFQVGRG